MKKLFLGITTIFLLSCNEQTPKTFSLTGTTMEIEDGTYLYLDHKNKTIDSAMVENNSFVFNTKITDFPKRVWLHTKDFSTYTPLWVEDNPMKFEATDSNFKNAIITGSETETLSKSLYSRIDTLEMQEAIKLEMMFVEAHPESIVSANILSVYSTTWGKEKTVELFDQFSEEIQNTDYGQQIARYIELNKEPKIGDRFADFKMETPDGEIMALSDLEGKTILLEFWASWCGPCRKENPNLVKTYETFKPKGFEVFAVSMDQDKDFWIEAIQKDSLNWTHVSDLKGQGNEASMIYGINGIPDNFLIDGNGEIIGRNLRGEALNQKLAEVLN